MKVNFVHICENAFFSDSKKLCLIEIFNIVASTAIPGVHPHFSLALNFSGEGYNEAEIVVVSPSKKEIFKAPFKSTDFPEKKDNYTVVLNLNNFPLPEIGDYKIMLRVGEVIISPEREDLIVVKKA